MLILVLTLREIIRKNSRCGLVQISANFHQKKKVSFLDLVYQICKSKRDALVVAIHIG